MGMKKFEKERKFLKGMKMSEIGKKKSELGTGSP
jgi:hypothetical protein